MRQIQLKQFMLLTLTAYLFVGCVKQETVASTQSMETLEKEATEETMVQENKSIKNYGQHSEEIENMLSAVPIGSEIYLEETKDGEWYLKIEKTFTSQNVKEEKVEKLKLVYGETILI